MSLSHLERIRSNSHYPAFRSFISVLTVIGYIAAVLIAAFGFFSKSIPFILMCIAGGALLAFLVMVSKELSLMLADIADATISFMGSQPDTAKESSLFREKIPRPADLQR